MRGRKGRAAPPNLFELRRLTSGRKGRAAPPNLFELRRLTSGRKGRAAPPNLFELRRLTSALGRARLPLPWRVASRRCGTSPSGPRSEEHTSELQSRLHLVCRLLLEKKKK